MMEDLLRFLHVMGAIVLVGTGSGIAFFMLMARQSRDVAAIAHVAGTVVTADYLFTATAAVAQPVTGWLLAREVGWPLTESWLALSIVLYGIIGALWLPVVVIQIRLRDIARESLAAGTDLPARWHRLYRIWFACGVPAFAMIVGIVALMLARPVLW
ncbi:MAG: DUF2269 domain-containing protein [Rhodobiaceae bacterium]|nr:DUF2269 domain-containing protein [Rhodobiaceae bacterium]